MNSGMNVLWDIKRSALPGHSVSFCVLLPEALWAPAVYRGYSLFSPAENKGKISFFWFSMEQIHFRIGFVKVYFRCLSYVRVFYGSWPPSCQTLLLPCCIQTSMTESTQSVSWDWSCVVSDYLYSI